MIGLGGALLGGWAEPAAFSCSGPAAAGGGYLATPPNFTTHSCPTIIFNTCGRLLAGLGLFCSSLATCGWPQQPPNTPLGNAGGKTSQADIGNQTIAGPELVGGVIKAGWWEHHCEPKDQGLQRPYLPPCFPPVLNQLNPIYLIHMMLQNHFVPTARLIFLLYPSLCLMKRFTNFYC